MIVEMTGVDSNHCYTAFTDLSNVNLSSEANPQNNIESRDAPNVLIAGSSTKYTLMDPFF